MYSVLIYGFPLMLVVFQWGLLFLLKVDTSAFIGPSFAAAALTFLIPLTRPKKLEVNVPRRSNVVVTSKADHQFIPIVWTLVLLSLFGWSTTCYLSEVNRVAQILGRPAHIVIGAGMYLVAVAMVIVKERV